MIRPEDKDVAGTLRAQHVFERRGIAEQARWQAQVQARAQALHRLAKVLGYALAVQPLVEQNNMMAQFRADMITLGVSPAELDAEGIRL